LPRRRAFSVIAFAMTAALAAAAGGCTRYAQMAEDIKEGNFLNKPVIHAPNWAKFSRNANTAELGPHGPVAPEDLVDASGRCTAAAPVQAAAPEQAAAQPAPEPAQVVPAPPRGSARVGSIAGDLASAPMPQGPPSAPKPAKMAKPKRVASANPTDGLGGLQPEGAPGAPVLGGIALGMTECQAVRRAGHPNQVSIGTANQGERKVVLTYLAGPWPGIYTFQSGRLKVIDAVPGELKADEPKKKKRPRRPAHTAATERVYVQ
jgi:hypothetical protein